MLSEGVKHLVAKVAVVAETYCNSRTRTIEQLTVKTFDGIQQFSQPNCGVFLVFRYDSVCGTPQTCFSVYGVGTSR